MKASKQWIGPEAKQWVYLGLERRGFSNVATSVCCPLRQLRIKVRLENGGIHFFRSWNLLPCTQNFKLCWRKILLFAPQNFYLLEPTWVFLGIGDSRRFLLGIPLCFPRWGLLYLSFLGELHKIDLCWKSQKLSKHGENC